MAIPAPELAVEIRDLNKVYRAQGRAPARHALKDVTLEVPRGSFFGLLGPNGAGKSTLINIMAGLVVKSSGSVKVWGYDIDKDERRARQSIGVVPQELNLDPFFAPGELLEVQAGLYGLPKSRRRTQAVLAAVGLADKAEAYARTLSGGMRRRLLVAKAMVHAPPVLVLDEPTAGVDIELRRQLWDYVRQLNRDGTTILLTTHYLEEAEQLCDRIAIINHGRLIACEAKDSLLKRLDTKALTITVSGTLDGVPGPLAAFAPELKGGNRLVFRYQPSRVAIDKLLDAVRQSGLTIADLATEESDLEDIFLSLTRAQPAA
ncbi:MAG: ABC transporter ATP-binding protein [Rhodospirillales bacterium]|nr:ABC transporter ATP-binding protein [Rhodospirillales bacterium]